MRDIALDRLVLFKYAGHDSFAARIGHELGTIAEQAARGDQELQAHAVQTVHALHYATAAADLLNHRARIGLRHIGHHALNGFTADAVDFLIEHLGLGHLELVPLTAHVFNQDGQVQFAAAAHLECVGAVGLVHAQGHVGLKPRA